MKKKQLPNRKQGRRLHRSRSCSNSDHHGLQCQLHFLPQRQNPTQRPGGRRMSWDLYRSIVDQSIELGIRRYSVYLMNEPMLDRELAERVAYVSARIKKPQYVKVTSHGGLLVRAHGRRSAGFRTRQAQDLGSKPQCGHLPEHHGPSAR